MKVHKAIISAYSSVLKDIILSTGQEKPVIYLKGVDYEDIKSIITFIYLGEVRVEQNNLLKFMQLADELQIKGLKNDGNGSKVSFDIDEAQNDIVKEVDEISHDNPYYKIVNLEIPKESNEFDATANVLDLHDSEFSENYTEVNMMSYDKPIIDVADVSYMQKDEVTSDRCDKCNFVAKSFKSLKKHRAMHAKNVVYSCVECDKFFPDRNNLNRHLDGVHGKLR